MGIGFIAIYEIRFPFWKRYFMLEVLIHQCSEEVQYINGAI